MEIARECLLGATAGCFSCLFTNPLEVAKTRIQLQGELRKRGTYTIHYRNVMHALANIARHDGFKALQSGLVPALHYQFVVNGIRLGIYQAATNAGLTRNDDGSLNILKCAVAGGLSGGLGAACGSPAYLIKTQLQAASMSSIAVGTQHAYMGSLDAMTIIYKQAGLKGLWRGGVGSTLKLSLGSSVQLAIYSLIKDSLEKRRTFSDNSIAIPFIAGALGIGAALLVATPFDVICTRLYNQPVDVTGRGLVYQGTIDCGMKVFKAEGLHGLYKGVGAAYFRVGPHATLTLVFWELCRSKSIS